MYSATYVIVAVLILFQFCRLHLLFCRSNMYLWTAVVLLCLIPAVITRTLATSHVAGRMSCLFDKAALCIPFTLSLISKLARSGEIIFGSASSVDIGNTVHYVAALLFISQPNSFIKSKISIFSVFTT